MKQEALGKEIPGWLTGGLILGTLVAILWLEHRSSLRRTCEDKLRHDARNLAMSAMTAVAVRLGEKPFTTRLAKRVHKSGWGFLPSLNLPPAVEIALAAAMLDYTLYIWHVLTHRIPFLWRFHRVHHVDLDLSTTTALRFHFVEMLLSTPFRIAQIIVIGARPRSLSVWQTLTLLAILFHHSNVRLPIGIERWLCRIVVTPRMHGIHHSMVERETNSNWGTILSIPDYLHRTIRLNVRQQAINIGVPAFRDITELRLGKLLLMPFREQRPTWQLDGYGTMPEHRDSGVDRLTVLAN